jgi:hypothetical protein
MRRLLPLLLLCLAALATPAAADEFVGRYTAEGKSPAPHNQAYKGEVQIEQLGALHAVLWKLEGGAAYKGIGIRQGEVLGVAYGPAEAKFGIVAYKINGGTLEGLWADSQDLKSELGKETLEGSPDINGEYKIVLGETRDGMTNYSGTVNITRNGNSYLFYWPLKPPSIGVGVRVNDVLVVAYTSNLKHFPGVVAYDGSDPQSLAGVWAAAGIKKENAGNMQISAPKETGSETLKRVP